MGSAYRQSFIERVINCHGKEIINELKKRYPSKLIKEFSLEMYNDMGIMPSVELIDGTILELDWYPLEILERDYPDCQFF